LLVREALPVNVTVANVADPANVAWAAVRPALPV
jgi:hypothetical protein